jgi:glyceraldehyde 3-phosphate dehydrogenase
MAIKVAINGFGRIGRSVARIIANRDDIELVAINDLTEPDMIKYLLDNDSVHGTFKVKTQLLEDNYILIGDMKVKILSDKNPENLDFGRYGANTVFECTGVFLTQEKAKIHLKNGVTKVILSAPAKDKTSTYVLGVNGDNYKNENIISNASCTTNCLAPIAKILDDAFGIEKGLMTTIHSYTNDQNILDVKHKKDKRRARAAAVNIIPTTTGAAKAIGLVLPQLIGKMHGQSVRVPTPNVSMVDLNLVVKRDTTKDEVNKILREKANNELKGILAIDSEYKVSQDFCGNPNSSIVAEDLTQVIDGNMVKVMAWYDNEWGYSNRLVDMAIFINRG